MKVILSRKGFDSSNGGCASPILPDGTLISMPIPSDNSCDKYSELNFKEYNYESIWKVLNPKKANPDLLCHLDPDIRPGIRKKQIKDWKPAFGQICAAQTHLLNKEVEVGDLFLFFGWFRQTVIQNRTLKYQKDAPNIHAIYGYLQIGDIVVGDNIQKYFWHPHTKFTSDNNTLYVSSDNLLDTDLPGAGTLRYSDKLCLTAEGMSRSKWKLPDFFMENKINISYHNANSYKNNYFQSASIGQEFVIAEDERVTEWAKSLICDNYEQI